MIALALSAALLGTATADTGRRAIEFQGVAARDQDAQLMEKGMLRSELRVLRGLRIREQLWILAADRDIWQTQVADGLLAALDADPALFGAFVQGLPSSVARSGPAIEGGQLRLKLPGNGDGLISLHLPALLSAAPDAAPLLNANDPNKAHLLAGFELNATSAATRVHLPRALRPLSRGRPPDVPLQPVVAAGGWVGLGEESGAGDDARALRKELDRMTTLSSVSMEELRPWPRRSGNLTELLRSVRIKTQALAVPEGAARTLTQDPGTWAAEARTVKHPSRYVALTAPVAVGSASGDAMMVLAAVAFYRPLVLTLEEAPLALGIDAVQFARAVHEGELPFIDDGGAVLFYAPWLTRWAEGRGRPGKGKPWSVAEAREQIRGWADRYGLRGLLRAADGPLPMRMFPIPDKERADLIDSAQLVRGELLPEDVSAWLKHQEPGLKQGKQAPLWSYKAVNGGERVEASFSLPSGAVASNSSPGYLNGLGGTRGSGGGGGGAESLGTGGGAQSAGTTSALAVELLDLYSGSAFCPLGREADAGLELALDGLGEGQTARLQVEWDLMVAGRSVRRDAFTVTKEAGTHEIDFQVPCPNEAGVGALELVLVDTDGNIAAQGTLALDVRAAGGRSWPALRKPGPKACVQPDLGDDGAEFSVGTTKGLSPEQVKAGIRGFQEQTLRCHDRSAARGQVQLELHVGCDGVVISSEIFEDGTGDVTFSECVAATFQYASFAAHDRDGGVVFVVPLRYD